MDKIVLYHGSPNKVVNPKFGLGNDKHDFGRGFYLTNDKELAKEWSVCRPDDKQGWVHTYTLDATGLKILDFKQRDVLCWLAELMKHRDADNSRRYQVLAKRFIEKYGIDSSEYDVIEGYRANASYFYIAEEFVRDNVDLSILEELLALGGLGTQCCLKSEKAYQQLKEEENELLFVDFDEFNNKYNQRDRDARLKMKMLINSERNKVENVFSTLLKEDN